MLIIMLSELNIPTEEYLQPSFCVRTTDAVENGENKAIIMAFRISMSNDNEYTKNEATNAKAYLAIIAETTVLISLLSILNSIIIPIIIIAK